MDTAQAPQASKQTLEAPKRTLRRVAIIGTAGRNEDGEKLNLDIFNSMVECAESILETKWNLKPEETILKSGGAAWADHVAVRLFLRSFLSRPFAGLHICLPCPWDDSKAQALDTGQYDWRTNPGKTMNSLHHKMSEKAGFDSLKELERAKMLGATFDCSASGFHNRNSLVAKSEYLLAFTFGNGQQPKDGGTMDTWKKHRGQFKIHVPLPISQNNSKKRKVSVLDMLTASPTKVQKLI